MDRKATCEHSSGCLRFGSFLNVTLFDVTIVGEPENRKRLEAAL
ncbi:hypothetical protein BCEN4_100007 [Burkholderia cenocepacia]|nr:hypothetical protein BCEN4_100007 [Burkholderia cenocepacia]